ncbi:MAG: terminase family protein [Pleurocapsa minor GSE-CHR-MK-17-07R]|jgi:phage terminase large subunit-like protein|nr:terminase family protein [Pleurocapsa minor GSE-CHR-MK 17-07R]
MASKARFRVVACGRRFGKTELGKWTSLEAALRGGAVWWVSPTYRMASQVWRDLKRACRSLHGVEVNTQEMRLELPNGGFIAIRSAHHPENLRGAGLDFVVLDEAAFMTPDTWPEVIRPMLADRGGAALFLSTPYGRNWFWEVYQLGQDAAHPDWASFQFSSYDNPLIPRAEIDAIRAVTQDRVFRAEYLAEFIDDDGAVFRGIRETATAPLHAEPVAGRLYVGGIDWGRSHDFTVFTLIDSVTREVVALDRFNKVGWALQRGRIAALCARWAPALVWAEENSIGGANIEALQAEGLPVRPFSMTAASKTPLIEALALAIERGDIRLPMPGDAHGDALLAELAAYTLARLPGGGLRFSAPPGLHDDMVISLALAWHGVRAGGNSMIGWE